MTFNFEHVGFPNNTGKYETVSVKWEGYSWELDPSTGTVTLGY